jgi:hypothetical protein
MEAWCCFGQARYGSGHNGFKRFSTSGDLAFTYRLRATWRLSFDRRALRPRKTGMFSVHIFTCAHFHLRTCVRACVRAFACVRACVHACVHEEL